MSYLVVLQAQGPNLIGSLWPLLLMFVVVFFFFIRPQAKRQKEQGKFLESLEKGDEVVTNSGLIGRINRIDGGIITLMIAEKTFVRFTKGSVSKEMTDAFRKSGASSGDQATTAS